MNDTPRFTALGKAISAILVAGLITLGAYLVLRGKIAGPSLSSTPETEAPKGTPEVAEVKIEVPKLSPPAAFNYKDNIVPIEISEYAGYAGLIAANGGLDPTEGSWFFKNHGFKVKLTVSEDEDWSELNEGKMAGSVTTVDVLAAYGRQLHAVVPVQIGFSRGADGVVVGSDIKRINQLKGKTIATAQFTEVDFFIRYLAQEAGLAINTLGSLDASPHPDRLNIVYTEDGFGAGDLFAAELKSGKNRLAGCVTWEPKVSEVVDGSGFPKSGDKSCGVARQWCGRLGKVDNCQVGVFLAYVSARGVAPLDRRLYLPREWAEDSKRRQDGHVPEEVQFQESWRIALDLLDRSRSDVPFAWVAGDDEFGDDELPTEGEPCLRPGQPPRAS